MILTINGGSSSIKFALFSSGTPPKRKFSGQVERIGSAEARLVAKPGASSKVEGGTFQDAVKSILAYVRDHLAGETIDGIGHRIVHGGVNLVEHQILTDKVLKELRETQPLDLAHLPQEIALIEKFGEAFPGVTQVACFDTAFHRDMPGVAKILAIPRRFYEAGVRRLGFHGLSYTYLMGKLTELAGAHAANGRVILAHLGSGASMAAVNGGKPVDTTMGFTPTGGLVMGTRPGDIDPGLLVYLMKAEKLSPDEMDKFISSQCGMLGISDTTSDMRDLIQRSAADSRAAEAVQAFCYQAKKFVGALLAVMGGLDTLVFSGGIGEHSVEARAAICAGLQGLGIELDPGLNAASNAIISSSKSRVVVRVIPTDEEAVIAETVLSFT